MSEAEDIAGLEAALLERARKLAGEHLANARQTRERMLAETAQRLRIEEEHEVLAAKAQAEHTYQQQVQAAGLDLHGELDRLRWELVNAVLGRLPAKLEELAADEARYLPWLQACLREGAQAIERVDLVAQVNAHDLPRLQKHWEQYAREAAPEKKLMLSLEPRDCIGGLLIASTDRNIRYDNTFEGRTDRLSEALQSVISDRLIHLEQNDRN